MGNRQDLLREAKFYLVLDRSVADWDRLFTVMVQSVEAGTKIVQLRSKESSSRDMIRFTQKAVCRLRRKALFIVNDRADIALAGMADGVHLGQEDLTVEAARQILGPEALIGVSCQSMVHVRRAHQSGADYIGLGSVFTTLTKPKRSPMDLKLIHRVQQMSRIPVYVIGGITLSNVEKVLRYGADHVAVTRAVCLAKDVEKTTREFMKILNCPRTCRSNSCIESMDE